MIRINLLGGPKKSKVPKPAVTMSAPNLGFVFALIVAGAIGGNYYYYWTLNHESTRLEQDLEKANAENRKLADVKAKYAERQKQFDLYDRRVKVIHSLQAQQTGPTELLTTVSNTINTTDAVWLMSMTDDGANIKLQGTALSANAIANLISNLKKTNYFKNVEMQESVQDDHVNEMQAFNFTIVCEKQKS